MIADALATRLARTAVPAAVPTGVVGPTSRRWALDQARFADARVGQLVAVARTGRAIDAEPAVTQALRKALALTTGLGEKLGLARVAARLDQPAISGEAYAAASTLAKSPAQHAMVGRLAVRTGDALPAGVAFDRAIKAARTPHEAIRLAKLVQGVRERSQHPAVIETLYHRVDQALRRAGELDGTVPGLQAIATRAADYAHPTAALDLLKAAIAKI